MLLYGRGRAVIVPPAVIALGAISMTATLVVMAIGFSAWKLGRRWSPRLEMGSPGFAGSGGRIGRGIGLSLRHRFPRLRRGCARSGRHAT